MRVVKPVNFSPIEWDGVGTFIILDVNDEEIVIDDVSYVPNNVLNLIAIEFNYYGYDPYVDNQI